MKLLITGGAGCLGSNIVDFYTSKAEEIIVVDNFLTGHSEWISSEYLNVTLVEGSVCDEVLMADIYDKYQPTHVIHAAASYNDPDAWQRDIEVNYLGSVNVAKLSVKHNVKHLINLQTMLCYGEPQRSPIPVDHPLNPTSSYAISKAAGESAMLSLAPGTVSLRIGSVISPRLSIGAIPAFYKRIKESQPCFCTDAERDFIDLDDFLSLLDTVMNTEKAGVFNVSSGNAVSIETIYKAVAEYLSEYAPPSIKVEPVGADDIRSVVLDPVKTESTFSWKCEVSVQESINKMLKWYDDNGVGQLHSHLKSKG